MEFTGLQQNTTLISLGIVAEDGSTFYAELTDYDHSQVNSWISGNVIDNLLLIDLGEKQKVTGGSGSILEFRGTHEELKPVLEKWLSGFGEVIIWSDCLAYDWVLFNNIFGNAFDIPDNVLYIPMDICTLFEWCGIDPDISREVYAFKDKTPSTASKHNALWDALVIKACYERLVKENK